MKKRCEPLATVGLRRRFVNDPEGWVAKKFHQVFLNGGGTDRSLIRRIFRTRKACIRPNKA